MNDLSNIKRQDSDNLAISMLSENKCGVHMTGHITDKIYKGGELVETIEGHNLVVNSFLNLVMCLIKQQSGFKGIQYWAIGGGTSSWDTNMPTPDLNATRLTSEIGRVPISADDVKFLTPTFEESSTPTNIIQIKHIFTPTECNGEWREFAIFGGNATATANSGIMLNKRHHAVITKTEDMTIERTMRFTLSLV